MARGGEVYSSYEGSKPPRGRRNLTPLDIMTLPKFYCGNFALVVISQKT